MRIQGISESKTVNYTALVARLRTEGRKIIDMSVGEPYYETPPAIITATRQALEEKRTRYGPVAGNPALLSRLAEDFEGYGAKNILIANGAKQALYSAFQVLCDNGDEVIMPRPYYASFSEQIKLAGGTPVYVDTRDHQPDCEAISRAITPKTKIIVINSPNNPTGAVYARKDLERIARLAARHNLYIIADEAYEQFVYDGLQHESVFAFKDIRANVIIIRSFSKSAAMTGFRVGYAAAHQEIIAAMVKLQGHVTGNVCTFAQHGALAALSLGDKLLEGKIADLQRKRDIAYEYMSRAFACIKPRGAFYIFPDISKHLNGKTAAEFAAHILEQTGVAVVPSEAFGVPNHLRISYAVKEENLKKGLAGITAIL